jgi:hypothetical protein
LFKRHVIGAVLEADAVLRGGIAMRASGRHLTLAASLTVYGLIYGAAMGAFTGLSPGHWLQFVYSAVKVPLLLLTTFLLSLPCFYVVNSLMGLHADFGQAVRALLSAQAGLTIMLASLAPVTLVWYASSGVYGAAILFNGVMFAIATFGGQMVLWREYRPLILRDQRHRVMLVAWLFVYAFVGTQMGWSLRPFIGNPEQPPQFFREDLGGNAYVVVARLIRAHWFVPFVIGSRQ